MNRCIKSIAHSIIAKIILEENKNSQNITLSMPRAMADDIILTLFIFFMKTIFIV